MAKCIDRKYCRGCRNDFYNGQGAKECWSRVTAKIVWRIRIGNFEPPPYLHRKKERVASCFSSPSCGDHFIDPEKSLDSRGYWK